MKKNVFIMITCMLLSIGLFGQPEKEEYRSTLKKMLMVSGSEESYKMAVQQMFVMFKQQYADVAPEAWIEFEDEFLNTSLDDLVDMMVPVYKKYLTLEDLEGIIRFYESPVGIKFARNTPHIMKESMLVGQQWGLKMGQEFEDKMQQRGFKPR